MVRSVILPNNVELDELQFAPLGAAVLAVGNRFPPRLAVGQHAVADVQSQRHVGSHHFPDRA
jgi:hypothetical protein